MDQEMNEDNTPASSRNNTQSMIIEETLITTRTNTQQTDQNMDEDEYETLTKSRNSTQQTNQDINENGENNGDVRNQDNIVVWKIFFFPLIHLNFCLI